RARLAAAIGEEVTLAGHAFPAFPTPGRVLAAAALPGIPEAKAERLRAVARAAQDGWLARDRLRAAPPARALADLRTLPGIGPFFAQGILYRGAGVVDAVTDDDITRFAVAERYGPDRLEVAERWRPYRMWAVVLLHVWVRAEVGVPPRTFARRPRGEARPARARPVS
ncbi:MAG TPA: hypothetical protein VFR49_00495, partial [Solirubrobacteraceae bacterium]|nr:hypothetical protein [Solirubrobacteraceae bacterium]